MRKARPTLLANSCLQPRSQARMILPWALLSEMAVSKDTVGCCGVSSYPASSMAMTGHTRPGRSPQYTCPAPAHGSSFDILSFSVIAHLCPARPRLHSAIINPGLYRRGMGNYLAMGHEVDDPGGGEPPNHLRTPCVILLCLLGLGTRLLTGDCGNVRHSNESFQPLSRAPMTSACLVGIIDNRPTP